LYYLKQNSEVSINRIHDEDIETEEDLLDLANGHGKTSNNNAKVPRC
jgi:hypothetical protein